MVSAGYSGLKVSPSSGFFVGCMDPKTHEYSRSLGRLLGRAAAVSAIIERIERIGSSTKEARLFHKLKAKSRHGKKYCFLAELALFRKEIGDQANSHAFAVHCASNQGEDRFRWHVAQFTGRVEIQLNNTKGQIIP